MRETEKTRDTKTVLVSGGSGFLGGWCVAELLRRGYAVRTTVRDLAREAEVRAAVASSPAAAAGDGPSAERPDASAERPGPSAERSGPAAERPGPAAERPDAAERSDAAERPGPSAERSDASERPDTPERSADPADPVPPERLAVLAADLRSDAGWAEAVAGCDCVLHVASPFPPVQPKDPDELIVPAREGTLRVLRAALDAGVERVVVTSSVAAITGGGGPAPGRPLDEREWSDPDNPELTPYARSKTIAELAAWDLARERRATERLATVNPGAIVGPVLGPGQRSFSLQSIERLLGGMPGVPRIGFNFVDVRDVADLHIRAMTAPEAGGERFTAVAGFLWMSEVAATLRDRLGEDAAKVPTRAVPNLIVRAMALFDPGVRSILGQLGRKTTISSEKAGATLGWSPRPLDDTIAECARSLLARA